MKHVALVCSSTSAICAKNRDHWSNTNVVSCFRDRRIWNPTVSTLKKKVLKSRTNAPLVRARIMRALESAVSALHRCCLKYSSFVVLPKQHYNGATSNIPWGLLLVVPALLGAAFQHSRLPPPPSPRTATYNTFGRQLPV